MRQEVAVSLCPANGGGTGLFHVIRTIAVAASTSNSVIIGEAVSGLIVVHLVWDVVEQKTGPLGLMPTADMLPSGLVQRSLVRTGSALAK